MPGTKLHYTYIDYIITSSWRWGYRTKTIALRYLHCCNNILSAVYIRILYTDTAFFFLIVFFYAFPRTSYNIHGQIYGIGINFNVHFSRFPCPEIQQTCMLTPAQVLRQKFQCILRSIDHIISIIYLGTCGEYLLRCVYTALHMRTHTTRFARGSPLYH